MVLKCKNISFLPNMQQFFHILHKTRTDSRLLFTFTKHATFDIKFSSLLPVTCVCVLYMRVRVHVKQKNFETNGKNMQAAKVTNNG